MINGFDFIRKIEGSVLFEQVCMHVVCACVCAVVDISLFSPPTTTQDLFTLHGTSVWCVHMCVYVTVVVDR